jgi:DNA-binding transcriptional ArsR family regulator
MRQISRGRPAPWWTLRLLLNDHVPATGAERQRDVRADLIDSLVMVMVCLLSRLDLRSLRVGHHAGRRRKHDFVGLGRRTIASWCDLSEETVSRVLSLLREAGLVHGPARGENAKHTIGQPWERGPDGATRWHPAIRRIDASLFAVLGLGPELHRLRAKPAGVDPQQDATARGRALRDSLELGGDAQARLRRLFPERPPDG